MQASYHNQSSCMPTICTVFYRKGRVNKFGLGRPGFQGKCTGKWVAVSGACGGGQGWGGWLPGKRCLGELWWCCAAGAALLTVLAGRGTTTNLRSTFPGTLLPVH